MLLYQQVNSTGLTGIEQSEGEHVMLDKSEASKFQLRRWSLRDAVMCVCLNMLNFYIFTCGYWCPLPLSNSVEAVLVSAFHCFPAVYLFNQCLISYFSGRQEKGGGTQHTHLEIMTEIIKQVNSYVS